MLKHFYTFPIRIDRYDKKYGWNFFLLFCFSAFDERTFDDGPSSFRYHRIHSFFQRDNRLLVWMPFTRSMCFLSFLCHRRRVRIEFMWKPNSSRSTETNYQPKKPTKKTRILFLFYFIFFDWIRMFDRVLFRIGLSIHEYFVNGLIWIVKSAKVFDRFSIDKKMWQKIIEKYS